jgi:hypothetical protein
VLTFEEMYTPMGSKKGNPLSFGFEQNSEDIVFMGTYILDGAFLH